MQVPGGIVKQKKIVMIGTLIIILLEQRMCGSMSVAFDVRKKGANLSTTSGCYSRLADKIWEKFEISKGLYRL